LDLRIPLLGAGGEPVDLRRTLASHGVAELPPMALAEDFRSLEVTLALRRGRPRTVLIEEAGPDEIRVSVRGRAPSAAGAGEIQDRIRHLLHLDQDLSGFYELASTDPDLSWVTTGAGRMIRMPTVFEAVVKTICTTNVSWGGTRKMVGALVEHLGEPAAGAPKAGWRGRAFPTGASMAAKGDAFYKDTVRSGYRGPYLRAVAVSVAEGAVDLEHLGRATPEEIPDEELEARLLALPGIGPYGAAHVMMLIGRSSRLILDAWTRPTYARLRRSRRPVSDATILRRFRRYGRHAGLAFWCYLTRDWVDDGQP
jgi:3-methyladenine DNA glycosylase/8-oxoguanine DNA glycosylase